jgi:hypothetical protein
MRIRTNPLKVGRYLIFFVPIVFLYWVYSHAQQPAEPAIELDNPNFAFSVYYTGNLRGNLEPCG